MSINLVEVEDAVVAAIRADATLGTILKTVAPYEGQLEEELGRIPHLFPAVFVFIRDTAYRERTNREEDADLTITLIVASQSLRGQLAARRETDSGVYAILKGLYRVLTPASLLVASVPDFPLMTLSQEVAVLTTKAMCVYEAQYRVEGILVPLGQ